MPFPARLRLLTLPILAALFLVPAQAAQPAYSPPPSPRATYSFNPGWKFIRQDVPGADQAAFDDSAWTNVSLPHTWNDVDSYRALISHPNGDQTIYPGHRLVSQAFQILPAGSRGPENFPRI
jgi:beta-galactosidase